MRTFNYSKIKECCDCEVKDYELKEVRNKLKSVEKYIEKLEVENGK